MIVLTHFKTSMAWQIATGFALGVIGMVALQSPEATRTMVSHFSPHVTQR